VSSPVRGVGYEPSALLSLESQRTHHVINIQQEIKLTLRFDTPTYADIEQHNKKRLFVDPFRPASGWLLDRT